MRRWSLVSVGSLVALACEEPQQEAGPTLEALMDPQTCRGCHSVHFEQWSGSMHAYASKDPVFLAMNRRGQEETDGKLGDFCVNCHAPVAVREGLTENGLNLADVPEYAQGVTCYFCHNVAEIDGTHNNPIRLENSDTFYGGIASPEPNPIHKSAYSALIAGDSPTSAQLCGTCHDIVTPSPPAPEAVSLEQTYKEWQGSLFGNGSCSNCHSEVDEGEAAVGQRSDRILHGHEFAGVDIALTPFPESGKRAEEIAARQRSLVQELLDQTLRIEICVQPVSATASVVEVTLDNVFAGHFFPSGATHDRRVWVEVKAYAEGQEEPVYESGVIPEGVAVTGFEDPDLWVLHDQAFDENGDPAHLFWEIASLERRGIPAAVTNDPTNPDFYLTHVRRRFPRLGAEPGQIPAIVSRVSVTVHMRPVGLDVLDDLIESGHLEDKFRNEIPTYDLIPNRHLSDHSTLSGLASASFEWSTAVRENSMFASWTEAGQPFVKECVGQARKSFK